SAYKAESETGTQALELLRAANPSPWTLISPAPEIAPGERTGTYRTELEVPAGAAISAEDFAVAMVDEILEPKHIDYRFTVANWAGPPSRPCRWRAPVPVSPRSPVPGRTRTSAGMHFCIPALVASSGLATGWHPAVSA